MTKTPPSHEGPAGPAVVPALSSHGVDRVRRRRSALFGAPSESSSYSRSYWVRGLAVVASFGHGRRFSADRKRASATHEYLPSVRC